MSGLMGESVCGQLFRPACVRDRMTSDLIRTAICGSLRTVQSLDTSLICHTNATYVV